MILSRSSGILKAFLKACHISYHLSLTTSTFYLFYSALTESVCFDYQWLGEFSVSEDLYPIFQIFYDLSFDEFFRSYFFVGFEPFFENFDINNRINLFVYVVESSLGESSVQRRLSTLKPDVNLSASSGFLSFVSPSTGFPCQIRDLYRLFSSFSLPRELASDLQASCVATPFLNLLYFHQMPHLSDHTSDLW